MPVLLRGLEPDVLRTKPGGSYEGYVSQPSPESDMAVQVFWERIFTQGFGREPERPVGEVVQPVTGPVTPKDKLARALHLMLTERMLMLPMVENNRVVGVVRMISQFDVPPTLFDILELEGDDEYFFGTAIHEQPGEPRAFISNYQSLGYYKRDMFTVLRPKRIIESFRIDPKTFESTPAPIDETLRDEAIAYYLTASSAFKQHKLKAPGY